MQGSYVRKEELLIPDAKRKFLPSLPHLLLFLCHRINRQLSTTNSVHGHPQRLVNEGRIGCLAKKAHVFLEPKKPTPMAQKRNIKSRHFPPTARITGKAGPFKRWEEWEEKLTLSLRAEGKTYRQISQLLPGRTEAACMNWVARTYEASTMPNCQKKWEDWEDEFILARRKAGCSHYKISELLSHRTAFAVKHRWNDVLKSRTKATIPAPTATRSPRRWTLGEDQLLESLRHSGQRWTQIAKNFPDCTVKQCTSRWHHVLHPQRTKSWTEWDERLLVPGNFADSSREEIAKSIPERTKCSAMSHWDLYFCLPKQDKSRTLEDLDMPTHLGAEGSGFDQISQEFPQHNSNACRRKHYKEADGIKDGRDRRRDEIWSAQEKDTLIALHSTIGPRWEEIQKHIPGRTEGACREYFRRHRTKKDEVGNAPSKYWQDYFMSKLHTKRTVPAPNPDLTH